MLLLFQEEGFLLLHDPLPNWLYASWMGQHTPEAMRHNYGVILQQARQLACTKLLNDSIEDYDGWSDLSAWLAQNCFPELAKSGIQAVAWVLPVNEKAFRDVQRVITSVKEPLIDIFRDIESAHNWLLKWPRR